MYNLTLSKWYSWELVSFFLDSLYSEHWVLEPIQKTVLPANCNFLLNDKWVLLILRRSSVDYLKRNVGNFRKKYYELLRENYTSIDNAIIILKGFANASVRFFLVNSSLSFNDNWIQTAKINWRY